MGSNNNTLDCVYNECLMEINNVLEPERVKIFEKVKNNVENIKSIVPVSDTLYLNIYNMFISYSNICNIQTTINKLSMEYINQTTLNHKKNIFDSETMYTIYIACCFNCIIVLLLIFNFSIVNN